MTNTSPFIQQLDKRIIVFDGSMGATIHNMPLEIEADYLGRENCVDVLNKSKPEIIGKLHASFLEVGADVIETNTFGAARHVLAEFDAELATWTFDLNKTAAEIARAACAEFTTQDQPRFVAGSMGPGTKLITLNQISWDDLLESYTEQARGLLAGGVDLFLIETCQDLLQVKAAINACLQALDEKSLTPQQIPIMVSITIETTGTMLVGSDIATAVHTLKNFPIASLGLNCATGPTEMTAAVEFLAKNWERAISVIPNAGLPILVDGKSSFPLSPDEFTRTLTRFVNEYHLDIVGGCCGTTTAHIAPLVKSIAKIKPTKRTLNPPPPPSCTSLYAPTEYRQELSFLIVGERMNAFGSRKFKRLLEEENWDEIVTLARNQVKEGAHVLDLNVDYAGRDNPRDAVEIITRVVRQVNAPFMLDSTQIPTLVAGLKRTPGKSIINSANFEEGNDKFDQLCELAKTYGAALVIGTIDEDPEAAMARTAQRKIEITRRAIQRATTKHNLKVEDIFIDPLVLPISTGLDSDRRSALELIEGTRQISEEFPTCQIICGLSNVSFGLKPAARIVLNTILLDELTKAGLTSAIVHASKIIPLNRIPEDQQIAALNLIHDRRHESIGGTGLPENINDQTHDPLQAFIGLFSTDAANTVTAEPNRKKERFTVERELRNHIIEGNKENLEDHLELALEKYSPLDIINDHLLEGMKTVGELFGSGQMQLPFVLQSAEVMKRAVAFLEPHMEHSANDTKGTIVLATVKGDVHDIGKNLVDIILTNNGYTVHNLGIKQPIATIVAELKKTNADAVGMSGLLVKSVLVMEQNLKDLNETGINIPILLGGAALSRKYAEGHLRNLYEGNLYYGKDAFEGLRIMDALAANDLNALDEEIDHRVESRNWGVGGSQSKSAAAAIASSSTATATAVLTPERADINHDIERPGAPFLGSRVVESIDLEQIYPYININALFRGQWGFKKGSKTKEEYEASLNETARPTFARLKEQFRNENILIPKVVYGLYPCLSEGNDLIIFDPNQRENEIERFTFPRQTERKRHCIADFFQSVDDSPHAHQAHDVVAFFVCTMGPNITEHARELFDNHEYTEYLYAHGLGVETAEALAEFWHRRIRTELNIANEDSPEIKKLFQQKYRGSRYSFGYPACPEMADQEKIFQLLNPQRIGCELTENYQIDPEQSVSAIVVHHPEAKYFNT